MHACMHTAFLVAVGRSPTHADIENLVAGLGMVDNPGINGGNLRPAVPSTDLWDTPSGSVSNVEIPEILPSDIHEWMRKSNMHVLGSNMVRVMTNVGFGATAAAIAMGFLPARITDGVYNRLRAYVEDMPQQTVALRFTQACMGLTFYVVLGRQPTDKEYALVQTGFGQTLSDEADRRCADSQ